MDFLFAQTPNRKGNVSTHTPKHEAVSGGTSKTQFAAGRQGAPKASGNAFPVGNKVSLCTPKAYDTKTTNGGYRDADRTNYLK